MQREFSCLTPDFTPILAAQFPVLNCWMYANIEAGPAGRPDQRTGASLFPIRDSISYRGPAPVTTLLIIANALVFLWQVSGGTVAFQLRVFEYGFIPALFFEQPVSEAFRLLSSMFMHGGIAHIVGNMWFLWVFGRSLELRLGWFRYLLLYLLAGALATFIQGVFTAGSVIPVIGASGAVSAVLGAYFILFRSEFVFSVAWFFLPLFFWVPVVVYLGYWALIQLLQALAGVPGTAWWAHLGGFVLGVLAGRRYLKRPGASTTWL